MKHGLMHAFGFVAAVLLGFNTGFAYADAVGPYYATPSWDQTLAASSRFIVLSNFNSAAVLDRETGLVWQRTPNLLTGWLGAQGACNDAVIGGRSGWRLPTVDELASLVDKTQANPALPLGHPFLNVLIFGPPHFWTANASVFLPGLADWAWYINITTGQATIKLKTEGGAVLCVRGGTSNANLR